MSAPGGLTVLVCDERHTASKAYARQPDGSWKKAADYDLGFRFRPIPHECRNLRDLAEVVDAIREVGNAVIVRGELDEAGRAALAADPEHRIARRKNAKPDDIPAHLTEAARAWVLLDIDGWPMPPGSCLRTGAGGVIAEAIDSILPEAFHHAECFWQLSSSAGFVPGVLKAHLCFWLSTPQDNAYLRAWFQHFAPYIDIAPFNAVQPHFVADPKIVGGDDPLPARTGWRHGAVSEVTLPPLPDVSDRNAHPSLHPECAKAGMAGLHAASIADALVRLGDGDGLDGFHRPLLMASMQYAIRVRRGGTRNDAKFIANLGAAIEAAPKRESRTDVAGYLDEVYLHRIINGAFHLIDNAARSDAIGESEDPAPVKLPVGFGMAKGGLYFTDQAKDDAEPMWVSQQFSVLGECDDGAGCEWGVVLAWRDAAEHRHTWIVPRELVHGEPHVIAARLESQGLRCNFVKAAQANLRR